MLAEPATLGVWSHGPSFLCPRDPLCFPRARLTAPPTAAERGAGRVFWFILAHFVAFLVDLLAAWRADARDKDVRILVLRHQVRLLPRRQPRPPLWWPRSTAALRAGP